MRLTSTLATPLLPLLLTLTSPWGATAYTPLSDPLLRSLPSPSSSDFDPSPSNPSSNTSLLAPLLIPRVPGTPGQARAQTHLVSYFRDHLPEWDLLWQNSTSRTPATGDAQIPFANLILRREPPWARKRGPGSVGLLTLVAHYDSKILEGGEFVGATDSAAPVAVVMWVAREVERHLQRLWAKQQGDGGDGGGVGGEGVQVLLLDGEEAFVNWTDDDSLYGARSLAAEWEATSYPARSTFKNPMRQISLFVLLDLLGAANPSVPSYFQSTHWAYQKMAAIEGRLRGMGLLESKPAKPFLPESNKMATQFSGRGFVGDDHVPFMARGAPVLHLIPSPFPAVWHQMEDDGEHLDIPTVRDWARIVTAFTMEWLDVQKTESKG